MKEINPSLASFSSSSFICLVRTSISPWSKFRNSLILSMPSRCLPSFLIVSNEGRNSMTSPTSRSIFLAFSIFTDRSSFSFSMISANLPCIISRSSSFIVSALVRDSMYLCSSNIEQTSSTATICPLISISSSMASDTRRWTLFNSSRDLCT